MRSHVGLVAWLACAPALAAQPPCEALRAGLAETPPESAEGWARYAELTDALPEESRALVAHARRRASEEGSLAAAYAVLRTAAADGCAEPLPRAETDDAARAVTALMDKDPRFVGERREPDALDRMKQSIALWLEELLESQLMQRYAGASRSVYLGALGVFLLFLAVRLWRARARRRAALDRAEQLAVVEREREKAFAAWRGEAAEHLARGEAREAMRRGQLALLARLGEVEREAVTPARTNREVLARLSDERRAIASPPLSLFERVFFGGGADARAATEFLRAVDDAAARLAGVA